MKRVLIIAALLLLLGTAGMTAGAAEYPQLSADSSTAVTVETAGALVCYRFVPEFSCDYTFRSVGVEDTYGELYDDTGTMLFANDDAEGMNFGITARLEAGKVYVLKVGYLDTAMTGTLDLVTSTNHDIQVENAKTESCFEDGAWAYHCTTCGHSWEEIIPAAHEYDNGACTQCGQWLVQSGSCGPTVVWHYNGEDGTLSISGTGAMDDYDEHIAPWAELPGTIRSVQVGSGVTDIGNYAFTGLEQLQSVTLGDDVRRIGVEAFSYCAALQNIHFPAGMTVIDDYAFFGCDLGRVRLPESVSTIGEGTFAGCEGVSVAEGNLHYCDDDGILYDKNMQTLMQAGTSLLGYYRIPGTVTSIGATAFSKCSALKALDIPEGVSVIGDHAFKDCSALSFLRIPASVTRIGGGAFDGCTGLQGIVFEGDAPEMDGYAFWDVTAIGYYYSDNTTWNDSVTHEIALQGIAGADIVVQPQPQEELLGNVACLVVGAYGENLNYQWWVCGQDDDTFTASSQTGSVYTVTLDAYNAGQRVYCVVSDGAGRRVVSKTVTVDAIAAIGKNEPISVTVTAGDMGGLEYFAYTAEYSCFHNFHSIGEIDTYCEIYDSNWKRLYYNDDGADMNFSIPVQLEMGKTYIIGVLAQEGEEGAFSVVVDSNHEMTSQVTEASCTEDGYTTHKCLYCEYEYVDSMVSAPGHNYVDHVCTVCGAVDLVVPEISLSFPSLSFECEIMYNLYFTVDDLTDVTELGLAVFAQRLSDGTVDNALDVIPGYTCANGLYMVRSRGVSAKNMADAMYFKVYAKLTDGTYVYSDVVGYNVVAYAKSILKNSANERMKQLVVSMLNYGAEAQKYFGYDTDNLMNSFLTEQQQSLVREYSEGMVASLQAVDTAKAGKIQYDGSSYTKRYATVSFDGALALNYYFIPAHPPAGAVKLYYWTMEDYLAATVLQPGNATGCVTMVQTDVQGQYWGQVPDLAAKQMDETVFVAGFYSYNGKTYSTGVLNYSIGRYCVKIAGNSGSNQQMFAKATAVYGYYAKEYFANL